MRSTGRTRSRSARQPRAGMAALAMLLIPLASSRAEPEVGPARSASRLEFGIEVWRTERGLPDETVTAIAQTADGYLWLGTPNGLVRWDGLTFRTFARRRDPGLPDDRIAALAADADETLWVGTERGLARFRDGRLATVTIGAGAPAISALLPDGSRNVWIGTSDGLYRYRNGSAERVEHAALAGARITALARDEGSPLWVGTDAGVFELSDSPGARPRVRRLLDVPVVALSPLGGSRLLAATGAGTVELPSLRTPTALPDGAVATAAFRDSSGRLWIGTRRGLFQRGDAANADAWRTRVAGVWVEALREDRDGSLWVGTRHGGLIRLRRPLVERVAHGDARGVSTIAAVHHGRSALWVGTAGAGVSRLTASGERTAIGRADGLASDRVSALWEDRSGRVWVGSPDGGLGVVDRGRVRRFGRADGLPHDTVTAIVGDASDSIWIGTKAGIARWEPDGAALRRVDLPDESAVEVTALLRDRDGVLRIGTPGGLLSLSGDRLSRVTSATGLAGHGVFALYEDSSGTLWIGTDGGLSRLRGGSLVSFTPAHGLPDGRLVRIQEDGSGALWLGSTQGLARVWKADLEKSAGRAGVLEVLSLGRSDGLPSLEIVPATGAPRSAFEAGRLWFGTTAGLVGIEPAAFSGPAAPARAVVESLVVAGRSLRPEDAWQIDPAPERVELRYTAPTFLEPDRVNFRYRLEGFDAEWVEAGTRRHAIYTNVPAGDYRFQVMAQNRDGSWSHRTATLPLRIAQPFHRTIAFYALCGFGALLVGAVAYRISIARWIRRTERLEALVADRTAEVREHNQQLEAVNRELERVIGELEEKSRQLEEATRAAQRASRAKDEFLANMSHEIRTPITAIIGMTGLACETALSPAQQRYLGIVEEAADSLLALINDVLDCSKIEAGKLELSPVAFRLRESLGGTLRMLGVRAHAKRLELACDIPPDVPDFVIGDVARLRQVLVNLVGNAIKFTPAGEVVVGAAVERQNAEEVSLRFSVRDTGPGIAADQQARIFAAFEQADGSATRRHGGTGLGLAISSKLVALMGGRIWVESQPGAGSTFWFTTTLRRQPHPSARPALTPPSRLAGLRALVADDNATVRRSLARMLEGWGVAAEMSADAADAGRRMSEAAGAGSPFDLALIDAEMPGADGLGRTGGVPTAAVMMLPPGGELQEVADAEPHGSDVTLIKPFSHASVLKALCRALGVDAADEVSNRDAGVPAGRPLRVLVAEDHPVNQELVATLLARRGHAVRVVSTGGAAVEATARESFDLVLMDVQMPEMDGLEAARTIRSRERDTAGRLPIVAMTAAALMGDRERCLEAGMDNYIAKPINPAELFQVLESMTASIPHDAETAPELLDRTGLLGRVEGDLELLGRMVSPFVSELPRTIGALRVAVARQDSRALERTAHYLKGAVSNFSAPAVADTALRLERMGRSGDLRHAAEVLEMLERQVERLRSALQALVAQPAA